MYCTDIFVFDKANCTGINMYTNQTREWLERQMSYDWIGECVLIAFPSSNLI